jgi:predicted dehydrogenase
VGIYCVQGALYTLGQNPIAVTAKEGPKTDPDRFKDVEESISWELEFPGGVKANCMTSYNDSYNVLRAEAEKGWFELSPAYAYTGKKGKTSEGAMNLGDIFEQVHQMDDFAKCVMSKQPSKVPGEMGLRDVKILMAIYEAAKTGKRIPLDL